MAADEVYSYAANDGKVAIVRGYNFIQAIDHHYREWLMIREIRNKIQEEQFELSRHAVDQSILRRISMQELREAIASGEIIEDYPEDKYGPSCLVLGFTQSGRPLHIQCSYPSRPLVKIITLYEPDPTEWIDFKVRREQK